MIICECIDKIRDKNNVIEKYVLRDMNGKVITLDASTTKQSIIRNEIKVPNLTLTSDGRLIDAKARNYRKADTKQGINEVDVIDTVYDTNSKSEKYIASIKDCGKVKGLTTESIRNAIKIAQGIYDNAVSTYIKNEYNDINKIDELIKSEINNSTDLKKSNDKEREYIKILIKELTRLTKQKYKDRITVEAASEVKFEVYDKTDIEATTQRIIGYVVRNMDKNTITIECGKKIKVKQAVSLSIDEMIQLSKQATFRNGTLEKDEYNEIYFKFKGQDINKSTEIVSTALLELDEFKKLISEKEKALIEVTGEIYDPDNMAKKMYTVFKFIDTGAMCTMTHGIANDVAAEANKLLNLIFTDAVESCRQSGDKALNSLESEVKACLNKYKEEIVKYEHTKELIDLIKLTGTEVIKLLKQNADNIDRDAITSEMFVRLDTDLEEVPIHETVGYEIKNVGKFDSTILINKTKILLKVNETARISVNNLGLIKDQVIFTNGKVIKAESGNKYRFEFNEGAVVTRIAK